MAGIIELLDRVATFFLVVEKIPVLGKIFKTATEKGGEAIGKKVEDMLGASTDQAKKSSLDEGLHNLGIHGLSVDEISAVNAFEIRLRENSPKEAESWVLFMAQNISAFKKETKKIINPKKGESGPRSEESYTDYTDGITWAVSFLRDFLKQKGVSDDETYSARYNFLKGKNAFSLISPEKKTPPIIEKATKIKTAVVSQQKANWTGLSRFAQEAETQAKQRFQDALNSRKKGGKP